MVLPNREILEQEIVGTEAAIKAHKAGLAINELVLEKFKETLNSLPAVAKKDKKAPVGVG